MVSYSTGNKTPGGAGTHTGHTGPVQGQLGMRSRVSFLADLLGQVLRKFKSRPSTHSEHTHSDA